MVDNHHAPWRTNPKFFNGDISPQIYDTSVLSALKQYKSNIRFILSTCDFRFLEKNFQNLITYQKSNSSIYFLAGIYVAPGSEANLQSALEKIKQSHSLSKIIFFVYTSPKLHQILQQKTDKESIWDYKINFIRNARYNLLLDIWKYLDLASHEILLKDSSAYIIDFDNVVIDDINHIIKREYGTKNIVFSWNSLQSPNKNFPDTLSGVSPEGRINHSYKIIKAGFTAFSPCSLTRHFLQSYRFYTIGDNTSGIFLRLFTFYFSDQVGILLALQDLRSSNPQQYKNNIDWIDIATSDIINSQKSEARYMWYPKGQMIELD